MNQANDLSRRDLARRDLARLFDRLLRKRQEVLREFLEEDYEEAIAYLEGVQAGVQLSITTLEKKAFSHAQPANIEEKRPRR